MKINFKIRFLKSIFLLGFISTGIGFADTFTGTNILNESKLSGGTVIDFSNGAGTTGSYIEGNVTFSSEDSGPITIQAHGEITNGYNTFGYYLQNNCSASSHCSASEISDSLKFSFSNPVSAFGFNWGASNILWNLKAYDSNDTLLETYTLPVLGNANNGEYFGISSDSFNINYATLIDNQSADNNDWVFIDNFTFLATSDDGDATYTIYGTTSIGQTLSTSATTADPDGNGTITSYTWQSSSDGSNWTTIGTSSTYTITSSEEGKFIRVVVAYIDGESYSEFVTASRVSIGSQLHNEWLQPFAAMQSIGLTSLKNNRDLVLAKAGECNDYGWVIEETDLCLYSNSSNSISYVNGNSHYGGYDYSNFNTSIILEKTYNKEWKAGIAYGFGSSNLDNFYFSGTTANFHSTNTHYSIYGFKQISKNFSLKGLVGGSDFDYSGNRNYLNSTAESTYDADGYTAEILGIWEFNKFIKKSNTLINIKPKTGIAFAAHTQDKFSESGTGDLVTIKSNQVESLFFRTGLRVENQILMEGGKWILIPTLDLNYEFDALTSSNNRKIGGVVKDSSDDNTFVSSKTLGEHYVSVKVGADFICTENLSFNLNAKYSLTDGGNQHSYGGGFRLVF